MYVIWTLLIPSTTSIGLVFRPLFVRRFWLTHFLHFPARNACQLSGSRLKAAFMRRNLFPLAILCFSTVLAYGEPNVAVTRLADGFDFPVGKPDASGYRKSRGFSPHGHLGEDWVGATPGAAFRDPVYAVGNGIVTLARDFRRAWGNVIVVRHAFKEDGQTKYADSLYAHLDKILVREGQQVARGEQI